MKHYKHSIAAILVALAVLASSCAKPGQAGLDAVTRIKEAGVLVLGTSADYPPYEFHSLADGKDVIVGFDIEIAKAIAEDLGVRLEIKDMQFDGLLAALQAGTIDLVISGMTPTAERAKAVDFSDIYYSAVHGVMVRAADAGRFESAEALKVARLSAQKGTIQVGIAKTQILGMSEAEAEADQDKVKQLGSIKNLVLDLKGGKVDAVVAELPVAKAYIGANPDLALAQPTFSDGDGGSAVAVKKGSESLVAAVSASLKRLAADGGIERLVAQATELIEG